jgi:hypothetical protein
MSELTSERSWFERVNVSVLSDDVRCGILWFVKDRLGFSETCRALGIAKSSLHRYLSGERRIPDNVVRKALTFLDKSEFEEIVSDWDKLKVLGIVKEDGVVGYGLALKILALASKDEYLKNAILRFVVQEFRDDLRKMLGISFAGIRFEWSEDFENFLRERKKHKKVGDLETVKCFRNLKYACKAT